MLQAEFDKLTRDNLENLKFVLDANGDVAIRVIWVWGLWGGTTVFTWLTDTPANYTGWALKSVRVNALWTGLEYWFIVNKDVPANALFTDTTYTVWNWGLTQINYTTTKDTLVWTAEQTVNKNAINGYAWLDWTWKLLSNQLPALAITTTYVVASQVLQLWLTVQEWDVAVRTDLNKSYIALNANNLTMADWQVLLTPVDTVLSVAWKTGVVVLVKWDVWLSNVDNTTDLSKPISTATQTALSWKQVSWTYASWTWSASWVNTGDVTLAWIPSYITIVWQVITRALINLTSHITWILWIANWWTWSSTASWARTALWVEANLWNPTANWDILSSTIAGVRSWITPSAGGWGWSGDAFWYQMSIDFTVSSWIYTKLNFTIQEFDQWANFNTSTYTAPVNWKYFFHWIIWDRTTSTTWFKAVMLYVNWVNTNKSQLFNSSAFIWYLASHNWSAIVNLVAWDTVELYYRHTTWWNNIIESTYSFFSWYRII